MRPDLKNEPLTPVEFEKLPAKITDGETWRAVKQGIEHKEYSARNGWTETVISIFPDDSLRLCGFLGNKTGIRLSRECGELLEKEGK